MSDSIDNTWVLQCCCRKLAHTVRTGNFISNQLL